MSYSSEEQANPKQFACTQNRGQIELLHMYRVSIDSPCQLVCLEVKYMQALLINVQSHQEKPLAVFKQHLKDLHGIVLCTLWIPIVSVRIMKSGKHTKVHYTKKLH